MVAPMVVSRASAATPTSVTVEAARPMCGREAPR